MTQYSWAANPAKLQRALAATQSTDEEVVKAKYLSFGGRLTDQALPSITPAAPSDADMPEGVSEVIEPAPVRKPKKAKKHDESNS